MFNAAVPGLMVVVVADDKGCDQDKSWYDGQFSLSVRLQLVDHVLTSIGAYSALYNTLPDAQGYLLSAPQFRIGAWTLSPVEQGVLRGYCGRPPRCASASASARLAIASSKNQSGRLTVTTPMECHS